MDLNKRLPLAKCNTPLGVYYEFYGILLQINVPKGHLWFALQVFQQRQVNLDISVIWSEHLKRGITGNAVLPVCWLQLPAHQWISQVVMFFIHLADAYL